MKIRYFLAFGLIASLGACATAPKTPEQSILGKWTCVADADGMSMSGLFDYMPGGKTKADVKLDAPSMQMAMVGKVEASWQFQPDGTLKEVIRSLKIESATMGGQVLPPEMISSMLMPSLEPQIVNQEAISSVEFEDKSFVITDVKTSAATTCTR